MARRPHHIPLELAIEVCLAHGMVFQGRIAGSRRPPRKRWRVGFLEKLRQTKRVRKTMEELGLSFNLVYYERRKDPRFDRAVRMAKGEKPWSEEEWRAILDEIEEREAEAG